MTQAKAVAAFFLILAPLVGGSPRAQPSEKPAQLSRAPKAVQDSVKSLSSGATLLGFSKERENGKTYYEVELRVNGRRKDVLLSPAGSVVEVEEEVPIDALPLVVKAAIEKHAGRRRIQIVESLSRNNAIVAYEVHAKAGIRHSEFQVRPDGQLILTGKDRDDAREDRHVNEANENKRP